MATQRSNLTSASDPQLERDRYRYRGSSSPILSSKDQLSTIHIATMAPRRSGRRNTVAYKKGDYVEVRRREQHSFSYAPRATIEMTLDLKCVRTWHKLSCSSLNKIMSVVIDHCIYCIWTIQPRNYTTSCVMCTDVGICRLLHIDCSYHH